MSFKLFRSVFLVIGLLAASLVFGDSSDPISLVEKFFSHLTRWIKRNSTKSQTRLSFLASAVAQRSQIATEISLILTVFKNQALILNLLNSNLSKKRRL